MENKVWFFVFNKTDKNYFICKINGLKSNKSYPLSIYPPPQKKKNVNIWFAVLKVQTIISRAAKMYLFAEIVKQIVLDWIINLIISNCQYVKKALKIHQLID